MNNTFDFNRFKKVVTKDFHSIIPQFGLTMLIIILIPMAIWLFCVVLGQNGPKSIPVEVRWIEIFGVIMLSAIMAPSRLYRTCNIPKQGIYFAMLPASKLEKFLSMVLFCFIVCPLLALAGSVVLDCFIKILPFGPYNEWLWQQGTWLNNNDVRSLFYGTYGSDYIMEVLTSPLLWISSCLTTVVVFFFTTTIFKSHKILKTILWCWLFGFVVEIVATPLMVNSAEWIANLLTKYSMEQILAVVFWGNIILNFVFTALVLWWTSVRLKRMKY